MKKIYLYPGTLAAPAEPSEITTILGSCVGVALHDPIQKVGGLCHYLLAKSPSESTGSDRYGDHALPRLIESLLGLGARNERLLAKVYGGAEVLCGVGIGKTIGDRNAEVALQILREYCIPIRESNTGGQIGRKLRFVTDTFEVQHSFMRESESNTPRATSAPSPSPVSSQGMRVAIIDSSQVAASSLQKLLTKEGLVITGCAADTFDSQELIKQTQPSAVVFCVNSQGERGVRILKNLVKFGTLPPVIICSLGGSPEDAAAWIEIGATDFVNAASAFDPALLRSMAVLLAGELKLMAKTRRSA